MYKKYCVYMTPDLLILKLYIWCYDISTYPGQLLFYVIIPWHHGRALHWSSYVGGESPRNGKKYTKTSSKYQVPDRISIRIGPTLNLPIIQVTPRHVMAGQYPGYRRRRSRGWRKWGGRLVEEVVKRIKVGSREQIFHGFDGIWNGYCRFKRIRGCGVVGRK